MSIVNRSRNGNDDEICIAELGRIGSNSEPRRGFELRAAYFPRRVMAIAIRCDLPLRRSKPIVGYFFPNSIARGKPTYPKPTTATTGTWTPFVISRCEADRLAPDTGFPGQEGRRTRYSVFNSAATSAAHPVPQVSGGDLPIAAFADFCSAPVP